MRYWAWCSRSCFQALLFHEQCFKLTVFEMKIGIVPVAFPVKVWAGRCQQLKLTAYRKIWEISSFCQRGTLSIRETTRIKLRNRAKHGAVIETEVLNIFKRY